MPFLAADWSSSRQRVLRFCANNLAPVLGAVAGAVGRLPGWLQDRLVQLVQPGAEQHARESIKALMTSTGVHNNFHLAQHEFRSACPLLSSFWCVCSFWAFCVLQTSSHCARQAWQALL